MPPTIWLCVVPPTSQNIRVVSAPAGHRVLVSMVPFVACAIRVSSALPGAWLAYQKVTAMVASVLRLN
jgi:hypothetical protein